MRATTQKSLLGVTFWLGVMASVHYATNRPDVNARARLVETTREIVAFTRGGPDRVELTFDRKADLFVGDGLYTYVDGTLTRIGEITSDEPTKRNFTAILDPERTATPFHHAAAIGSEASLEWIYEALLPDSTKGRIRQEWITFRNDNLVRFVGGISPIVRELLEASLKVLKEEVRAAVKAHGKELWELADVHGREVLIDSILPLLVDEIWPIAILHASGPIEEIARELWRAAPLFGLAWRGVYDQVSFGSSALTEEHWQAFIRSDAVPIVDQHRPELERAIRSILRDILVNDAVRTTMRDSLLRLREDDRLLQVFTDIGQAVLDSPRLRATLQSALDDPRLIYALDAMQEAFDDFNRRVVKIIILDSEQNYINPHFARFLRTIVLKKDWRWVLVTPDASGSPLLEEAPRASVHPIERTRR